MIVASRRMQNLRSFPFALTLSRSFWDFLRSSSSEFSLFCSSEFSFGSEASIDSSSVSLSLSVPAISHFSRSLCGAGSLPSLTAFSITLLRCFSTSDDGTSSLIFANSSIADFAAELATLGSTTEARKATVDMIGLPAWKRNERTWLSFYTNSLPSNLSFHSSIIVHPSLIHSLVIISDDKSSFQCRLKRARFRRAV